MNLNLPKRPLAHQGPINGGEEDPGTPGSSPSTVRRDYGGLGDQAPIDPRAAALAGLKRLVRGVY